MSVLYIAHRGCPRVELENTLESFEKAGNGKYYGIETDITLISDGNVIVYHDDNIERLTGKNYPTRDLTIEEVNNLNLISKNNKVYKIPSFIKYIEICRQYNKVPVIDVKWGYTTQKIDELMDILKKQEMYDKSIIICYTMKIVLYIREKYPDFKVQFLAGMLFNEENVNICLNNNIDLDVSYNYVTKELVDRFHEKGLKVNCWTVDSEEVRQQMIECGVDYITSNVFVE